MDELEEFENLVVTGLGSRLSPSLWAMSLGLSLCCIGSSEARGALPKVLTPSHPNPGS